MFDAASEVRKTMSLATWQSRSVERAAALKIDSSTMLHPRRHRCRRHRLVRLAHFNIPQQLRRGDQDYGQRIGLRDDALMERLIEIAREK